MTGRKTCGEGVGGIQSPEGFAKLDGARILQRFDYPEGFEVEVG